MQNNLAIKSTLTPIAHKPRTALKLVKTNNLSREDWLTVRKTGIGSSDAATAIGLNPYKSQLELWLEKTGRDMALKKPDPNDDLPPMFWGNVLEPVVAEQYAKRTGNKVRRVNAVLQHPEHSFMLANLDREVIGSNEVEILECKTTGMNGAKLWRDGVPEYVQLQVQHQLAVTGKKAADVACLVCGNDLRTYRIERDEVLIAKLVEQERLFWRYVETDTPPPADGSDSAASALQALYPHSDEVVADFSGDSVMERCFADLVAVRARMADLDDVEAKLRQQIQQTMASSGKAVFSSGEVTWRKTKDTTVLDTGRLLKDQPDLLQRYGLARTGSRRFVINPL